MNVSVDLSVYRKNTKKHPVYLVPEVKIKVFEDIPRLHVRKFILSCLDMMRSMTVDHKSHLRFN